MTYRWIVVFSAVVLIIASGKDAAAALDTTALWSHDILDERADTTLDHYLQHFSGDGVHVYVVDTGIARHEQFNGVEVHRPSFENRRDGKAWYPEAWSTPKLACSGHGTAVASVIAGSTVGLAHGVILHDVHVQCTEEEGLQASVVKDALEWILANAKPPAIVNFSHRFYSNSSIEPYFQRLVDAGIVVVVAAGNDSKPVQDPDDGNNFYSPARMDSVITVGGHQADLRVNIDSNFGPHVDLFAPGAGISAATAPHDRALGPVYGTSFSAAFVSAAAAMHLERYPTSTPAAVKASLVSRATAGRLIRLPQGSPNRMLYTYDGFIRVAGSQLSQTFNAIAYDSSTQRVYAAGGLAGDAVVEARTLSGTLIWRRQFGTASASEEFTDISFDKVSGKLFLVGQTTGHSLTQGFPAAIDGSDLFILQVDAASGWLPRETNMRAAGSVTGAKLALSSSGPRFLGVAANTSTSDAFGGKRQLGIILYRFNVDSSDTLGLAWERSLRNEKDEFRVNDITATGVSLALCGSTNTSYGGGGFNSSHDATVFLYDRYGQMSPKMRIASNGHGEFLHCASPIGGQLFAAGTKGGIGFVTKYMNFLPQWNRTLAAPPTNIAVDPLGYLLVTSGYDVEVGRLQLLDPTNVEIAIMASGNMSGLAVTDRMAILAYSNGFTAFRYH